MENETITNWPQLIKDSEPTLRSLIAARSEADGECIVWTGAKDTYGVPIMRLTGHRKLLYVRRVIAILDGVDITGKLMMQTCECPGCIKHFKPVTRKALQIHTAKVNPYAQSVTRNKKIADKARKRLSLLTPSVVREMRSSGLSSRAAARKYGVCQSAASDILSHRSWREYVTPWSGL